MVHLPRVAAFDDEPDPGPLLLPHEMVVHGRGEQEGGNRGARGAGVAVRQYDDVRPEGDRLRNLLADLVQGGFEPRSPLGDGEQAVDGEALKPGGLTVLVDIEQLGEVVVADDRVGQGNLAARCRLGLEQVALRPDGGFEGGDELLADGVEGRVGHLGEKLGEIVVEKARPLGEHGNRGVGAHGADRLGPRTRHRLDDEPQLLGGHPEESLMAHDRGVLGREHDPRGRSSRWTRPLGEPLPVGVLGGQDGLDLVVLDDAAGGGVDEEHLSRLKATFYEDRSGVEVQYAHLRGEHDQALVGHPVAGGAQPVAVEHGPDHGAVGESDGGGAVPGLHERGVEAVEGPPGRVHLGVVLPRLGDHHQHGVGEGPPAKVEQLEDLVEGGRVAPARGDDGEDPRRGHLRSCSLAKNASRARIQFRLPCEGVDLAVVGDEPVGVSERPGGERVCRESRVHEGDAALEALVGEVGEEAPQLMRGEHALVDDRPCRQRGEVDPEAGVLDALSHDEALPLEGVAFALRVGTRTARSVAEEDLGKAGRADRAASPVTRGIDRHLAPSEHRQAFLAGDLAHESRRPARPERALGAGKPCPWRSCPARRDRSRPPRDRAGGAAGRALRRRHRCRGRPRTRPCGQGSRAPSARG